MQSHDITVIKVPAYPVPALLHEMPNQVHESLVPGPPYEFRCPETDLFLIHLTEKNSYAFSFYSNDFKFDFDFEN